jgi:hypothetical protein
MFLSMIEAELKEVLNMKELDILYKTFLLDYFKFEIWNWEIKELKISGSGQKGGEFLNLTEPVECCNIQSNLWKG